MSISTVAPVGNSTGAAALTDVGIGSGLNVDGIVSSLMEVESQPLTQLNNQISSYNATLTAYGTMTSAISAFQTAVQALDSPSAFNTETVTPGNASVLSGTATTSAVSGNYNVNVSQLAQAQSLTTAGQASASTGIGTGTATTISFQFGTTSDGLVGTGLDSSVAANGIAAGSLLLDGTTINTSASTTSASALATQINLATSTTGITATAQAANSGTLTFNQVTTGAGDSYNLTVGGVTVASLGANSTLTAAQLDAALQSTGAGSVGAELAANGISFTGTAAAGTLQFTSASGANLTASQTLTNTSGSATGGLTGGGLDTAGTVQTYLGSVTLTASSPITVAGSAPSAAGFTAGTFNNSTFTQNTATPGGSVTINSSDNSLQGIASAINAANLGVSATIINNGSGDPYQLSLTSTATGAASSMKISVSGDSTLSNLLTNDPGGTQTLTQSVAAQNANLTINGIPITSASNTVTGAVQGVTLNLTGTGTTAVAVSQNSSAAQSAVSSFVTAYNTLNTAFGQATAYNATTQVAGPLLGDFGVETVQAEIRQIIGSPIAGASQNLNSLAQLGITFQSDGSMALNTSTLQSATSNNLSGLAALFSSVGTASDSLVSYQTATSATQPGTYGVDITQLATQGTETGSALPGSVTITSGSNDQLAVDVDGINATVTLAAGTYTPASLATAVQSAINGSSTISKAGSSVNVAVNGSGALSLTSQRYGSASLVSLSGDAADTVLGTAPPTSTTGVDVAGTIGGNPAVGSGQVLTASAGSPTAGLALTINGGTTGSRGTITYSQGYADQLNTALTSILGSTGPITNESNSLNSKIASVESQITTLNTTLAAQQANYMSEFEALDTTISSLDATQTFLTQQLASLATTEA